MVLPLPPGEFLLTTHSPYQLLHDREEEGSITPTGLFIRVVAGVPYMRAGTIFQQMGRVLEDIEDSGVDIENVTSAENGVFDEGSAEVTLDIKIPLVRKEVLPAQCSLVLESLTLCDDGNISGHVVLELSNSGEATKIGDGGVSRETEDVHTPEEIGIDANLPYYENQELLESVYEECDTFNEMTDALDVDVTPATVRQHMIKHDIHEPRSIKSHSTERVHSNGNSTTSDPQTEPDVALPDGLDMPEDLTVTELKEIVQSSRTIHEAQQRLGVPRSRAKQLLRELNLLDLVTGRISNESCQDISTTDLSERIRAASPG